MLIVQLAQRTTAHACAKGSPCFGCPHAPLFACACFIVSHGAPWSSHRRFLPHHIWSLPSGASSPALLRHMSTALASNCLVLIMMSTAFFSNARPRPLACPELFQCLFSRLVHDRSLVWCIWYQNLFATAQAFLLQYPGCCS